MASVTIRLTCAGLEEREFCDLKIFREAAVKKFEGRYRFHGSTYWQLTATIGGEQRRLNVSILTDERLGLGSQQTNSVASTDSLPRDFGQSVSEHHSPYPMFDIHENLKNRLKASLSREISRSQYLRVAEMAFEFADSVLDGNRLLAVFIRTTLVADTDAADRNGIGPEPHHHQQIYLERLQYNKSRQRRAKTLPNSTGCHRAYIALGSNVGDRVAMIESACREMDFQGIHVDRTSALYETEPMYLHDQQRFINAVCEVC